MRPKRLELIGFGAFRERTVVDFEDADLFALVGPTGAGKSTIIDAICFSLYGCVPRYDDRRRVGMAISNGALEAKLRFDFEAAGSLYVATRVVRKKSDGAASTKEARLERSTGDGESDVLAGSEKELTEEITRILGLPFEHFTKCVVLPQGEFAQFLRDKPAERQDLLVRLLNLGVYDRVRTLAVDREAGFKALQEHNRSRLVDLAGATPEARAEAKARKAELSKLIRALKEARRDIGGLEQAAEAARGEAENARSLLAHLGAVAVPKAVADLSSKVSTAVAAVTLAQAASTAADKQVEKATEALAKLPKRGPLEQALEAFKEITECEAEIAGADEAQNKMTTRVSELAEKIERGKEKLRTFEAEHETARRAHQAYELAATLSAGEPCPVCEHPVRSISRRKRPEALDKAEAAVAAATTALNKAQAAHAQALQEQADRKGQIRTLRGRLPKLERVVHGQPDRKSIGGVLQRVVAAEHAKTTAEQAQSEARRAESSAQRTLREFEGKLRQHEERLSQQRDPLVPLEPPKASAGDLMGSWTALVAWAQKQTTSQSKRAAAAEEDARRKEEEHRIRLSELATRCKDHGVVSKGKAATIESLMDASVEAEAAASSREEGIAAGIEERNRLEKQLGVAKEAEQVAHALALHLAATGFERWLVTEALDRLVDASSAILRQLSSGRYSLVRDARNDFEVVDHHNADERRSAKTLSGGETFQASLALALALADQVSGLATEGAAQIESIFLDEGFGTLDGDSLEAVAGVIEALGQGERTVGIVTHSKDLADRVPVRFVVTKGPKTSSVARVV